MKLGEVLVRKGLITKAQLKEALEAQLIYGGHLGTCLMELSYVTERILGNVLSEFLDVGFAPAETFQNIPRHIIATLPDRVVENHQAVPLRLQERVLDVAMVDPKDLARLDALSFASGYKVKPWVAPEARIFQAMERYYDIPRRLRYVTLCREIDRNVDFVEDDRTAKWPARTEIKRAPMAPFRANESAPSASVNLRAAIAEQKPATAIAVSPEAGKEQDEAGDPLAAVARQLAVAESVDRVAKLAVDHAARELNRCLVFLVRAETALPWQAAGIRGDASRWSTVSFHVTDEPVFGLLNGEDFFRGPIPQEAPYRQFYKTLEVDMPEQAILVSAHVDDRLVAIFYGDGGTAGPIRGEDDHYRRLVRKMGLALNMVAIRRGILTA